MKLETQRCKRTLDGTSPLRVLIVEDAATVRRMLRDMLAELSGVRVVGEAETVAGAREAFRSLAPDAVTVDLQLPDGSGIDVLREIKAARPECVAIVLTNYPDAPFRRACQLAGADHFLDKSSEFDRVAEILRELAMRGTREGGRKT